MTIVRTDSGALKQAGLQAIVDKIQDVLIGYRPLTSAGLAIGTSSKKAIKIASATKILVAGNIVTVSAAEKAFTATTHDVAHAKFAIFVLSANSAGTVTVTKSDDADTLAEVVIPATPSGETAFGAVIINPTGTGAFDATSTDLDDVTVVPNAVYINFTAPFDGALLDFGTVSGEA